MYPNLCNDCPIMFIGGVMKELYNSEAKNNFAPSPTYLRPWGWGLIPHTELFPPL